MKTILPVLFMLVYIISPQISAQDVIYKQNGEAVNAKILNQTGSAISYRYYDNRDSLTYIISTSVIDSIIYQNGVRDIFNKSVADYSPSIQSYTPDYRHHLTGTDFWALLYNNVSVSYEYLPGKANLGFKLAFSKRLKGYDLYDYEQHDEYYPVLYRFTRWYMKAGMDYYIFPPRTFRLGMGLNYLFGQYLVNKSTFQSSTYTVNYIHGLTLTVFGFYNITKNLAYNLGVEIPVYINPKAYTGWLRCEIMYNF